VYGYERYSYDCGLYDGDDNTMIEEGLFLVKFAHLIFGVLFLTVLWYFNLVHIPQAIQHLIQEKEVDWMPDEDSIQKMDTAMKCFRIGVVGAWFTGALYLFIQDRLLATFLFEGQNAYLGVGAWIGTILFFNVFAYCSVMCNIWAVIAPKSMQCEHTLRDGDTPLLARKRFIITTRIDWILSFVLLFFMSYGAHGYGVFN
jgi:uncharacterized membrane protein